MITGREALATVEQAIGRARNQESRLDAALRSATEEAVRLRSERMQAFRELARLKLEEGLVGEIDEAERTVARRSSKKRAVSSSSSPESAKRRNARLKQQRPSGTRAPPHTKRPSRHSTSCAAALKPKPS